MVIKDLTTPNVYNPNRAITRVGKVFKGGKKRLNKKGKEIFGEDLDYFRIELEPRFSAYREDFFKLLRTAKPTELQIRLIGHTVEDVFDTAMEHYTHATLRLRCDGETRSLSWDSKSNGLIREPLPCLKDGESPCQCNRVGRLHFRIPEFTQVCGRVGKFTLTTHSSQDIRTIFQALSLLYDSSNDLMGMPIILGREPRQVGITLEDGKRANITKSLIYIDYDAKRLASAINRDDVLALPAGAEIEISHPLPASVPEPAVENADVIEPDYVEDTAVDVDAIYDFIAKEVQGISSADVAEAIGQQFDLNESSPSKLDLLICVLEYWCSDPMTGEKLYDQIEAIGSKLLNGDVADEFRERITARKLVANAQNPVSQGKPT